jgi:putative ABC transport system permease protein
VNHRRYRSRGLYLWLALLTFCAVFAATAGARETLASRTQAARQAVAATLPLARTITVSAAANDVQGALANINDGNGPTTATSIVPPATIGAITSSLHADFNRAPVSLTPVTTDWSSMTTRLNPVNGTLPGTGGTPVKIELTERQPLGPQVRLLSGRLPTATPVPSAVAAPAGTPLPGATPLPSSTTVPSAAAGTGKRGARQPTATVQVVMTRQTAATFGLHAGSQLVVPGPELASTGVVAPITVLVTGIVVPVDPASSFWGVDPDVLSPGIQGPAGGQYWAGGVIVGPDEAAELQSYFGSGSLQMEWVLPLDVSSLEGQQVQPLSDALNQIRTQVPTLPGALRPVAATLTVSSVMSFSLNAFIATAQSVDGLLWLLYVSLMAAGLAVLLLAAWMVAMRRSAEITVIRARGASLRQIAVGTGRDAALVCVPAAVIAAAAAILAVPGAGSAQGAGSAGGWWPPIVVTVAAAGGPALFAAWQHRLPRRPAAGRRRPQARLVIEGVLVAASVAGIVSFRDQGTQAGTGVNLYTSSAPILVAIPAVIVVLRLYPLVLRGLLRACARGSRAPAFLGLARASRAALTPALPAFALVLALTVAAFAGMMRDAVINGDVAASWRTAGADATVTPSQSARGFTISPAAARAVAAVPGVTHAAEVMNELWITPAGGQVSVLAVDPASYAALAARIPGFSQLPAGLLATPDGAGAPQPVLVSPQAAALLGTAGQGSGAVTLSTRQAPLRPVRVRVAGVIASTPALPGGGAFVIMPLAAIKSTITPPGPPGVNELLLTGGSIDRAQLTTVVRHTLPDGAVTFRSDVLSALTSAPLQHGAFTLFSLAVVVAAILGLAIMLLELALGAPEREATLARLATMGLGEGQRAWMVALEVLPAVIAAAVAAWACALALPPLLVPDIDLSVFTGSPVTVKLAADVASLAVPLAGLAVLVAVALGLEIRLGRHTAGRGRPGQARTIGR